MIYARFWCSKDSKASRSWLKWAYSLLVFSLLLEALWIPAYIMMQDTSDLTDMAADKYDQGKEQMDKACEDSQV